MTKDDQIIVVGNWFCQYFSIELKSMTYIQREHIPLQNRSPQDSQLTGTQCCIQREISIEPLTPRSSIKLQTLILGRYPKQRRGLKRTIFPSLTVAIVQRKFQGGLCMHVCMYACMHACMYVCMYICMYVYMYVCKYVCIYVCIYLCIYVCMYVCMHLCMYVIVNICIYIYVDTQYIYMYINVG